MLVRINQDVQISASHKNNASNLIECCIRGEDKRQTQEASNFGKKGQGEKEESHIKNT